MTQTVNIWLLAHVRAHGYPKHMPKVTETAETFDVSDQTIRTWAGEFSEFLSPTADPGGGKPRYFTPEDMRVFAQVAQLRERNASYDEIHQSLAAGDRADPPRSGEESAQDGGEEGEGSRALVTRLTATVARFEGELNATKDALDHTRQQLEEERAARVDAEKRASLLEGKLEILERQGQQERPSGGENEGEEEPAVGWWDRLLGRG